MRNFRLKLYSVLVAIFALLALTSTVCAVSEVRTVMPNQGQATVTEFDGLQLEVPAGATDQLIIIERGDSKLDGISKPYGFQAVGLPYRFGPQGLQFSKDKALKVRLHINPSLIPAGFSKHRVKLYYINHEAGRLEQVPDQKIDPRTGDLIAPLRHFSDYVPGVTPSWDGNGINPFLDYAHDGDESVSLYDQRLTVLSNVYSLKGRGMDLNLTRVLANCNSDDYISNENPFKINNSWRWALPYWYEGRLYLGNGASYDASADSAIGGNVIIEGKTFKIHEEDGFRFLVYEHEHGEEVLDKVIIYLSDGTRIETFAGSDTYFYGYQLVSDRNGNTIRYNFSKFQHRLTEVGDYDEWYRFTSLVDTVGRVFTFTYSSGTEQNQQLLKVEQQLASGAVKTILTHTYTGSTDTFSNTLNQATTYNFNGTDNKITYYNGVISEYLYSGGKIITHKLYQPGQTVPYRTVTYSPITYGVEVNDGTRKVITRFTNCECHYTQAEETYSLDGDLLKKVTKTYTAVGVGCHRPNPTSVSTQLTKADSTLGTVVTYQYESDMWNNITRIIDPLGTETRMSYINTESNQNLSQFNPSYQNYIYGSFLVNAGWHNLATKATLVNDPVHLTTQLRQSHYQYDTKGNLLRASVFYNGGYINTDNTYDQYGNVILNTDSNGNSLTFEYSPAYQSAYLTNIRSTDNITIATFEYDFDLGKKIMATDPKGNIFRYQYDLIGRTTREYLDNPNPADSTINVAWELTYDDLNSMLNMRYGSDAGTWQEGKIDYDPLFGKPRTLWRKLNGAWVKTKEFEFDTEGMVALEKDNMGHTTKYEYDELDRKAEIILPDFNNIRYNWDDHILRTIYANGSLRTQVFDLLDRLIEVRENPDPTTTLTTSYTYDNFEDLDTKEQDSHLVKVINPRNAEMVYSYDNLGRLTQTNYPQDGSNPMAAETYTYDNVGNLLTKTDGKGTKTMEYEYFAGYRLKQVTEPGDNHRVIENTYDNNDNLLTQTSPGGSYTYTYDARNRATTIQTQLDGNSFNFSYGYDVFGRVTSLNYPNRTNPVTYQYDDMDRLQTIPGYINACTYDGDNKLTEVLLSNGLYNTFTYDTNDRPANIGTNRVGVDNIALPDEPTTAMIGPSPQPIMMEEPNVEAESMNLTNFSDQTNAVASGGKLIVNNASGARASFNFTGGTGAYDMTIYYFDDNTGQASFVMKQNGTIIDQWVANLNLGSGVTSATRVSRMKRLTINTNDLITIESTANGGDLGRIDNFTFVPPVIKVEAESMALHGYSIDHDSGYTSGTVIQNYSSHTVATASYVFNGASGVHDLLVHYYDRRDSEDHNDVANFKINLNGVIIDQWSANSTSGWKSRLKSGVNLISGDTIAIEGIADTNDNAILNYITITPGFSYNIETENTTLTNYTIENNIVASGGKLITYNASPAIASFSFTGLAGPYDLNLNYFDENDGLAVFAMKLNGNTIDQWVADKNLGNGVSGITRVSRTVTGISLNTNDTITIESRVNSGDLGCVDNLIFTPPTRKIEAESMNLSGYQVYDDVDSGFSASGDHYIQLVNNVGNAVYSFNGGSGTYDLAVSYYDWHDREDGNDDATFRIKLNGITIDEWQANSSSTGWIIHNKNGVNLKPNDIVTVEGVQDLNDHAILDYLTITPRYNNKIEAEKMTLVNYTIVSNSDASSGSLVKTTSAATAEFTFTGVSGYYNVKVVYYDLNTGSSLYRIYQNNNEIGRWYADRELGSDVEIKTRTSRFIKGVWLNTNDLIEIKGTPDGGEYAWLDCLEFYGPTEAPPPPVASAPQNLTNISILPTATLMSLNYNYDPVGNVTRLNGDHYGYDGLNRLTWAGNLPQAQNSSPWSRGTAWTYDGAGNRTGQNKYLNGQLQESLTYTYDLANRLLTAGSNTYENNSAGARIGKIQGSNVWSYIYDGESRLTSVQKNGTGLVTNTYDGSGMRTKKVGADGKTTYYVYSGANPILDYTPDDGKYTYYIYAGSKSIAEESGTVKTFYHRDHLGSTRATTDQNGKITGLCKYDAWGKLESTNEYDEGVVNGEFELATNSGQILNWVPQDGDCTYVAIDGQNGSHALKISRTAGSSYWYLPNVFASPDTDYELNGYFYSGNEASVNAKAKIVYYDMSGAELGTDETELLGYSSGWKRFTLASHSPVTAAYMEIRLTQGSEAGMVVYFDGVKLKIPGLAGKYDFTGKKEDEECGLKYFGARFYDEETGRFITKDNFTYLPNDNRILENLVENLEDVLQDGFKNSQYYNQYIYTLDNPLTNVDEDGHRAKNAVEHRFCTKTQKQNLEKIAKINRETVKNISGGPDVKEDIVDTSKIPTKMQKNLNALEFVVSRFVETITFGLQSLADKFDAIAKSSSFTVEYCGDHEVNITCFDKNGKEKDRFWMSADDYKDFVDDNSTEFTSDNDRPL